MTHLVSIALTHQAPHIFRKKKMFQEGSRTDDRAHSYRHKSILFKWENMAGVGFVVIREKKIVKTKESFKNIYLFYFNNVPK